MGKTVSYKKNKARGTNKKAKVANKGRTMKKSGGMRKSTSMRKRTTMRKSGGAKKRPGIRKQRGGNDDLIKKINDELLREKEKGNISDFFLQCLYSNNETEKMVDEKAAKWGDLTVSEWTTRVILDNENCQHYLD